jgi:hypothetical protein
MNIARNMKIIAGFSEVKEVSELIKCGAGELYCGLISKVGEMNHKGNTSSANLTNMQELKEAIHIAHEQKTPVYLAINQFGYSKEARKEINNIIKEAIALSIDGFIIAEISLISFIKNQNSKTSIIISCLNPCFNSESVRFYTEMGASRITFPRHITPYDIQSILRSNKVETEIFFNEVETCKNIDAFCRFHTGKGGACFYLSEYKTYGPCSSKMDWEKLQERYQLIDSFELLYESQKSGVDVVKLGFRMRRSETKYSLTNKLKMIINLLESTKINKEEFIKRGREIWSKR